MKPIRDLFRFVALLGVAAGANADTSTPQYRLSAAANGAVTVERGGKRSVYRPHFTVIRAETDPKLRLSGFASTPGEKPRRS